MAYRNRPAFWGGLAAVTAGVVLHLPMFIGASDIFGRETRNRRLEEIAADELAAPGTA
jgi:hypothetical protein